MKVSRAMRGDMLALDIQCSISRVKVTYVGDVLSNEEIFYNVDSDEKS